MSAGAIIFGKNILTTADENKVGLKDSSGFNLVNGFSIWCHYTKNEDPKIFSFVRRFTTPVIAITEKSGIFVKGSEIVALGFEPVFTFSKNRKQIHTANSQIRR